MAHPRSVLLVLQGSTSRPVRMGITSSALGAALDRISARSTAYTLVPAERRRVSKRSATTVIPSSTSGRGSSPAV
jgi:hypothetical protein